MRALLVELVQLPRALSSAAAGAPAGTLDVRGVDRYVRGMRRKCVFAMTHLQLLHTIDWSQVDGLGRDRNGLLPSQPLIIVLDDACLEIRHPSAVVDHVYLATDGLVAAVVNLTDTFARLVNEVYRVGIPERKASLFSVRDKCTATSSLGQVLREPQHQKWLECVKDLRGRCQHADVEEVLSGPAGCLGKRVEPHIPAAYCWQQISADTPLAAFGQTAVACAESTLIAAIRAIIANPTNPIG